MKIPRQSVSYAGAILWGFAVMASVILLFFPYQKALKIVSRNILGSTRMIVALEGSRFGFMSAEASKVVIGHVAVEGRPLFELRKVDVRWYPLWLLTGKLAISSKAVAYDGTVECSIDGIPVLEAGNSFMRLKFNNVNLAKYPEASLPWFKSMSGSMSGWIRKEVGLERSDKQKGSFRITMTAGEIKELRIKGLQNFVLGYKEVVTEGKISGSKIIVERIFVEGDGIRLKGSGTIESVGLNQNINLRLVCEESSKVSPLTKGSVITVKGNQWSPDVTISTEPAEQAPKAGLLSHEKSGLAL